MRHFASLALAVVVLASSPALAQQQAVPPGASPGWYVVPSFSLTGEYDSNVFGTGSPETDDVIGRVTPGIAFGYQSQPLTLWARYAFGAEVFADNSDLNGINRQRAGLEFRYLPNPRLTLGLVAAYNESEDPNGLLQPVDVPAPTAPVAGAPPPPGTPPPLPSVEVGRQKTKQYLVSPAVSYRIAPGTTLDGVYTFTRSDVEGSPTDNEHEARVSVSRELTRLDTVSAAYTFRYFDPEEDDSLSSHAITLGYRRKLTEATEASIEAGPRIDDDGEVGAEVRAGLTHRFTPTISGSLGYSRTQNIVSGRSGAQTVDSVSGDLTWQALRELLVTVGPRFSYFSADDDATGDTRYFAVAVRGVYRITQWLSARVEYFFTYQDEEQAADIERHVFSLSLDFTYPIRVY